MAGSTQIAGKAQDVAVPVQKAFDLLSDFTNYETLMPEGRVSNWEATPKECSFLIKGMSAIGMEIREATPPSSVKIRSTSKSPIRFDLACVITPNGNEACTVQFTFSAELNAFLKMMVEKPLGAFFTALGENAKKRLESGLY